MARNFKIANPDAEIYRLAEREAVWADRNRRFGKAADAIHDRITGPVPDTIEARLARLREATKHPDYRLYLALDAQSEQASQRQFALEKELRATPTRTFAGILFKLEHLMNDALWPDVEPWLKEPLAQCVAELKRINMRR